ncbi:MAG: hypothetical protein H3C54_13445 [Taibaiella sp.]|nr:hypothetical protein [Taibaiella sp.]
MLQPILVFNPKPLVGIPVVGYADICNPILHSSSIATGTTTYERVKLAELGNFYLLTCVQKYCHYGSMREQDKTTAGYSTVESKEGERRYLSCNKAGTRSPSLGFNPNDPSVTKDMALDYLASILVEAYFAQKAHEREQHQTGGHILPGIH